MLEPAREIHGLVALWSSRLLNGTPFQSALHKPVTERAFYALKPQCSRTWAERIAMGWLGDPQVQEEAPQQAVFADSDSTQKPSGVAHLRDRLAVKARKPA
ncbi:Uncharacterised protein [Comamonas testosteroni]|uniref:Uncharacterized protein n=1 Tax=Comamonas testosteroni TaxID=285 RepID=A0A8B4S277_COMTE|nr:Uncharacterised protein [Comamonas testosteroni]